MSKPVKKSKKFKVKKSSGPIEPPGFTLKDKNILVGHIRIAFKRSAVHKAVMQLARRESMGTYPKSSKPRVCVDYQCANCQGLFKPEDIEVDHIEEVGGFQGSMDAFICAIWCIEALFKSSDLSKLQVLCKPCHKVKTAEYKAKMSGECFL